MTTAHAAAKHRPHRGTIIIDSLLREGEKEDTHRRKKAEKRTLDAESLSNFSCPSTPFSLTFVFSSLAVVSAAADHSLTSQFAGSSLHDACTGKENDVNHVSTSSLCVVLVITHRVRGLIYHLPFFLCASFACFFFSRKATKNYHTPCVHRQRHLIWTFGTERGIIKS